MIEAPRKLKFTVEDYYRLSDLGFLPEGRTELLDGEIYEIPTVKRPHAHTVDKLVRTCNRALDDTYWVRGQNPIALDDLSEPEPDVTIARTAGDEFLDWHPRPDDIVLVIEVADTSYAEDVSRKLPLYARAGIVEVWIVNLNADRFEVYRNPTEAGYDQPLLFGRGATVAPLLLPDLRIAVDAILPFRA